MRKMWAAGAAIGLVLALSGIPTVAQEEGQRSVMVTGRQSCDFRSGTCTFDASDPRVTGTGTVHASTMDTIYAAGSTPVFAWDEVTLEGPDGSWSGHHYAVADEEGRVYVFMALSGAGAYEGWQYVATATDTPPHGTHDLVGVLFEGPVPPIGPVAQAAAQ